MLTPYLSQCPLIAILRGITPEQSLPVTRVLLDAGFCMVEVPLNSPKPFDSINAISAEFGDSALIGAGTVTAVGDVEKVHQAGGKLIFSPNCNLSVIEKTKQYDMVSIPGCCTPSEVFAALEGGADAIKFFPSDIVTPPAVKAMRAVLPAIPLLAVGGINNDNMLPYLQAGIRGFGIGSSLYKPGKSLEHIKVSAQQIIEAFRYAEKNA
ncbi:MAG: 2-dehydro-3-deoxy-6-phosphogalactonate aldolase [Spongiibacteraceae bacterium]|nr:2-dehydro-3-deoxy-6-phosphogalactonate aldolase [Spongiibacteraceae bacterium]